MVDYCKSKALHRVFNVIDSTMKLKGSLKLQENELIRLIELAMEDEFEPLKKVRDKAAMGSRAKHYIRQLKAKRDEKHAKESIVSNTIYDSGNSSKEAVGKPIDTKGMEEQPAGLCSVPRHEEQPAEQTTE